MSQEWWRVIYYEWKTFFFLVLMPLLCMPCSPMSPWEIFENVQRKETSFSSFSFAFLVFQKRPKRLEIRKAGTRDNFNIIINFHIKSFSEDCDGVKCCRSTDFEAAALEKSSLNRRRKKWNFWINSSVFNFVNWNARFVLLSCLLVNFTDHHLHIFSLSR